MLLIFGDCRGLQEPVWSADRLTITACQPTVARRPYSYPKDGHIMRMRVWHNSLLLIGAKIILTDAAEKPRTHTVNPIQVFRVFYLATLFQRYGLRRPE